MNAVTIGISSVEETRQRMLRAFDGAAQGAFISFPTVELLWKVLTAKRWEILRAMTEAGPVSIREIARRVGRDVKTVHGDVHALLKAGVIDRSEDGRVVFPYDAVHVDFVLRAARHPAATGQHANQQTPHDRACGARGQRRVSRRDATRPAANAIISAVSGRSSTSCDRAFAPASACAVA